MNETYDKESVYNNFAQMVTDKAISIFGDNIASPDHEPLRFAYQMKVVNFVMEAEAKRSK